MKKVILFVCTVFTLSSCAIVSAPVNGAIYQKHNRGFGYRKYLRL